MQITTLETILRFWYPIKDESLKLSTENMFGVDNISYVPGKKLGFLHQKSGLP